MSGGNYHYVCNFVHDYKTIEASSDEGIGAFKDGFWINTEFKYTKGSDCVVWIPPHAILFIDKVAKEAND